jgi:hypothetical protein
MNDDQLTGKVSSRVKRGVGFWQPLCTTWCHAGTGSPAHSLGTLSVTVTVIDCTLTGKYLANSAKGDMQERHEDSSDHHFRRFQSPVALVCI